MMKLARKVKAHTVTADEIAQWVAFTKENGGIEYADKLYAGRAQDGHFERSYKDKYEQNWTMNLYAENVSLGSGSDGGELLAIVRKT